MSKAKRHSGNESEKYREIDGVVFDLDSYARHCKPPEQRKVRRYAEIGRQPCRNAVRCACTRFRGRPLPGRLVSGRGRSSARAIMGGAVCHRGDRR